MLSTQGTGLLGRHWTGTQEIWLHFLALPQILCVTVGKSPDLSVPQFSTVIHPSSVLAVWGVNSSGP